jgi:triosephosphate isomerase
VSTVRKPIVAGNWKMNMRTGEATDLAAGLQRRLEDPVAAEVLLCPPFTALPAVAGTIRGGPLKLGAQNVHWEARGAYTGEISAAMLHDLGCDYVIVGHSERRTLFHESDDNVLRKVEAVLAEGMRAIVCVGETLEQREAGRTEEVVRIQVENGLRGVGDRLDAVVVAYEPVWAIGTGRTATPDQAQQAHAFIREVLGEMAGESVARAVRIQYGGSVKPSNAEELFALPDVDGGLIGGASLEADSFAAIVRAAR